MHAGSRQRRVRLSSLKREVAVENPQRHGTSPSAVLLLPRSPPAALDPPEVEAGVEGSRGKSLQLSDIHHPRSPPTTTPIFFRGHQVVEETISWATLAGYTIPPAARVGNPHTSFLNLLQQAKSADFLFSTLHFQKNNKKLSIHSIILFYYVHFTTVPIIHNILSLIKLWNQIVCYSGKVSGLFSQVKKMTGKCSNP